MRRDKTPEPPTNPPEPEHHHEEHDFRHPKIDELDGVGKTDMEEVEFTPFIVIHQEYECARDGCDATESRRVLFAMEDVLGQWNDEDVEKVAESAERVDHNIVQVSADGDKKNIEPRKIRIADKPYGACNGKPPRTDHI